MYEYRVFSYTLATTWDKGERTCGMEDLEVVLNEWAKAGYRLVHFVDTIDGFKQDRAYVMEKKVG